MNALTFEQVSGCDTLRAPYRTSSPEKKRLLIGAAPTAARHYISRLQVLAPSCSALIIKLGTQPTVKNFLQGSLIAHAEFYADPNFSFAWQEIRAEGGRNPQLCLWNPVESCRHRVRSFNEDHARQVFAAQSFSGCFRR